MTAKRFIDFNELTTYLRLKRRENIKVKAYVIITENSFDGFFRRFERKYIFDNFTSYYFDDTKYGRSIYAYNEPTNDYGVRLDWYIFPANERFSPLWEIEECGIFE